MSEPEHHPVRFALAVAGVFVAGMLTAVQSRINGQLAHDTGDAFVTSVISFGSGLVILGAGLLFARAGRAGIRQVVGAVRGGRMPWWYLAGGTAGAVFVLTQSLVVALIGVALFTVGIVAGQLSSSVIVDRRGLGTMAPQPFRLPRVLAAVLALVGVIVAVSGEVRGDVPFGLLVLPVIAGALVGMQAALNGQVRRVASSAYTATFANFVVGTTLLVLICAVHLAIEPWTVALPPNPLLYLGGTVGVVFIAAQAVLVRTTGVLVLGLAVLSGQLVMAVVFDAVLPLPGNTLTFVGLLGAALTLVAVVIAVIPARRPRGRQLSAWNPSDREFMQ
ncbi:MAG TPA: DMT family transporter [Pseudolysinimonas sp.]|jgi:transporter family-2 protein|nr:DMT family transporter [Pseudolysinimonas sp.]